LSQGAPRQDEDEKQRIDRELAELLQELRVALPGVQVLFAFLLILPFSQGFGKLDAVERDAYIASLVCATISTALLMLPTAYHRLRFRQGDKKRMLYTSNRAAIAGVAFLALAMSLALLLIVRVVLGDAQGYVAGVCGLILFGSLWYALPLAGRRRDDD
jgi:hypothetical protein